MITKKQKPITTFKELKALMAEAIRIQNRIQTEGCPVFEDAVRDILRKHGCRETTLVATYNYDDQGSYYWSLDRDPDFIPIDEFEEVPVYDEGMDKGDPDYVSPERVKRMNAAIDDICNLIDEIPSDTFAGWYEYTDDNDGETIRVTISVNDKEAS